VDPPLTIFMIPPIVLFSFKVAKLVHLYRSRMGSTRLRTAAAALAGIALSHTIAKAVAAGLFTSGKPFFRTPKCKNSPVLVQAIVASLEETCLTLLLWIAAFGVIIGPGKELPGAICWSGILFIQSLPYVSSLVMSLINAAPLHRTRPVTRPAVPVPSPY
jgi:hypothetical protein